MSDTVINADVEMNNDLPEHRAALITTLQQQGLDAYGHHSGGGLMHVVVDLLRDDASGDLLQAATGSVASLCDVSLMGWRNGGNVQDSQWTRASTLQDAEDALRDYVARKDYWISRFHSGALDV